MNTRQRKNKLRSSMSAILALAIACCCGVSLAQPHLSKAAYHKVFADAISAFLHLKDGNNLCLPPMFWTGAPGAEVISINLNLPQFPSGPGAQLQALEEAGLVTGTSSQRTVNGKIESFRNYTKTEKGASYFSEGRFCYARAELDKIVKWKGPATFDEYRIALVYFTAKASNVADWATNPAVLAAFPSVKAALQDSPPKVRQVFVDLSSEGWEVNELSKFVQ
jgi:hypothetical protein